MGILQQCQKWNKKNQHQKIIDALESRPERTTEMDMELARAYLNLAGSEEPEVRSSLRRALELMRPHEEALSGSFWWNFHMGYAFYFLDQEVRALRYFETALHLHPDDESRFNAKQDIEQLIDTCEKRSAMPQFSQTFRERVGTCWKHFAQVESNLRQILDEGRSRNENIVARIDAVLKHAFEEISFEVGFNGDKHELTLSPEGDKVKLFELVYFQKQAPQEVLEHWSIVVGRQPCPTASLDFGNGWEISAEDVRIWLEHQGDDSFAIAAYCEKLLPLLCKEEGRAWWMLATLTDLVLGEICHMRYIDSFEVLREPKKEASIGLSLLPNKLRETGIELSDDPQSLLGTYLGYEMQPDEDPDADWRLDVTVGSTCCMQLINGYLNGDNSHTDNLHADGAVAGFVCYPLHEEECAQKVFAFRDSLEAALTCGDGQKALTIIGGATGLYCGYVDFIAWDIQAALDRTQPFFADSDIPWANFRTFRRGVRSVGLKP